MRIKAVLLIGAVIAMASPAFAQGSYYRNCEQSRNANQVGGMILGGILGGVVGSNSAASGHRHDGTAVGAVLGGIVGSGIGRGSVNCGPPPGYDGQRGYSGAYGEPPRNMYPVDPGYEPYGYSDGYYEDRDIGFRDRDLYRDGNRSYNRNDDYAGRDCTTVMQKTRLPDGTTITRPVEACRDTYYGDWQVRD